MEYNFKELEKMLAKYKWYLKESKLIELAIRNPMREVDENIGGGKSSNQHVDESTLRTLIKLDEDETLNKYLSIGFAIEKTYAELPQYLQEAMTEFYINRHGTYRGHAKRVSAKLNIDVSTLYRWREKIVNSFYNNLKENK
ncbi:hypothetical protein [Pisciglobus halotolerans]|uniref:Phage transcriptional activator, RinA family n=1 Tax=Pisciglobus halotolerans TaxID=745365 RepID=A0A1I3C2A5_9LACT|nr:hypothetical protein [Pisciglobus halotolerans]SFH68738.1 phage transcriptional activator, RinA family [Pisciglobus halotolerans]